MEEGYGGNGRVEGGGIREGGGGRDRGGWRREEKMGVEKGWEG